MKRNKILLIALVCGVCATTFSLVLKKNKAESVYAYSVTQKNRDFAAYTYSGSYYDNLPSGLSYGMQGNLRKELSTLTKPKSTPNYSSGLSSILQQADEDPENSNNMILFYARDSVTKQSAGTWNREHVWPQSLSNECWGTSVAGSDLLHIRPTYTTTNTKRDNCKYAPITGDNNIVTYNGMVYGKQSGNLFEPLDVVKGDCARIIMYVWVAHYNNYPGEEAGSTRIPDLTNVFYSYDTLMLWHILDAPDALEGNRNNYAQTSVQKNRNPFVDHPEYAWKIFGEKCSLSVRKQAMAKYPDPESEEPPVDPPSEPPVYDERYLEATTWANSFNEEIGAICDPNGKNTNYETLKNKWLTFVDSYVELDDTQRGYLLNPNLIDDADCKAICQAAKEKHDYVFNKYPRLIGILVTSSQTKILLKDNTNEYLYSLLITGGVILIATSFRLTYQIIRKRKEKGI